MHPPGPDSTSSPRRWRRRRRLLSPAPPVRRFSSFLSLLMVCRWKRYGTLRLRNASFVCLVRARGRISRGMEDAEDAHGGVTGVLERMLHERRQVHAAPPADRVHVAVDVQPPFSLDDVQDLVVDVAVHGGPTRRDQ